MADKLDLQPPLRGDRDANRPCSSIRAVGAEELYVTNGETTDFADVDADAAPRSSTPELEEELQTVLRLP